MSDKNQLTLNHDASCSYSEQLTANLVGKCRTENIDGVKYLVAKIAALNPGVLNGSRGPLLYTPEDTRKATKSWNDVPLVVYHPTDNNGHPISAKTDGVVHVGFTKNANYNGKLSVEGWFDIEKTKTTDSRVYDALVNGTPMEVSTGLGTTNEEAPAGASYLGQLYSHIARNHKPDHLAILPDQRGACSINDGCGLHVNQQVEDVENCGGRGGKPGPCPTSSAVNELEDQKAVDGLARKFRDEGSQTYVSATRSDNMGMRHFIDISHKDPKIEAKHVEEATKFFDGVTSRIRTESPNHRTYVSTTKSPNMGTRVFADLEKSQTRNSAEDVVCTNCDASGECEECKAKRLKKTPVENEEELIKNTENCGGKGGKPGPCPKSEEDEVQDVIVPKTAREQGEVLQAFIKAGRSPSFVQKLAKKFQSVTTNKFSSTDLREIIQMIQSRGYVSNDRREFLKTLNCGGEGGKPGPCPVGGSGLKKTGVAGEIESIFRDVTAGHHGKIKGATYKEIKTKLRGKVPQSQPKFVDTIDKLGFKSTWSNSENAWIVHNQSQSSIRNLLNLVANSDTYQGVPIMAGKLSDTDRQKLVDGLITNSGFEIADIYNEEDTEVLNAMSDEKLFKAALAKQTLIDQQTVVNQVSQITGERNVENMADAIQNAFKPFKKKAKDEEDDEEMDDEDEGETMNSDIRVPRQMTEAEFMRMAPPSIRADLEFSRATQNKEKQELIGSITANVSGDDLDQAVNYLRTKPLPELRIIANMASKPAAPEFDVNIRRSVNYGGMAVPTGNRPTTNKRPGEGPKPVVINWAELSKNNAG